MKKKIFARIFGTMLFMSLLAGKGALAEADRLSITHMVQCGNDVSTYVKDLQPESSQTTEAASLDAETTEPETSEPETDEPGTHEPVIEPAETETEFAGTNPGRNGFFPRSLRMIKGSWMRFIFGVIVFTGLVVMFALIISDWRRRKRYVSVSRMVSEPGRYHPGIFDFDIGNNMPYVPYNSHAGEYAAGEAGTVSEPMRDEKTIDEGSSAYVPDDEATIDEGTGRSQKVQITISFNGREEVVERYIIDQLVLGRGKDCDIDVTLGQNAQNRKLTSRIHASLINHPEGIYIRDEGARNKTYLNGDEISDEVPARDGDVLQLGKAMVTISFVDI